MNYRPLDERTPMPISVQPPESEFDEKNQVISQKMEPRNLTSPHGAARARALSFGRAAVVGVLFDVRRARARWAAEDDAGMRPSPLRDPALAVVCPVCKARPGLRCSDEPTRESPHPERLKAALEAYELELVERSDPRERTVSGLDELVRLAWAAIHGGSR